MKKLFLLFALFGVLAVGCEELFPTEQSSNTTPIFRIDGEGEYIVSVKGEEIAVMVTTNIDYSVVIPEDAKDWLSVAYTRSETREEILIFVVARNDNFEERRAKVELVDANVEALETLSFVQDGLSKIFETNSEEFYFFEPEGSSVTIDVTTNLEYSVVIDQDVQSWLSVADTRATLREETLTFTATPNDTDKLRYAFVKLVDADKSILQEIPFLQNAITQSDSSCPNDEIWYTTTDGNALTLNEKSQFNVSVLSNTYIDGKGVIKFDGNLTEIGAESFYDCSTLLTVHLPKSLKKSGHLAFGECWNLTGVYIYDLAAWCNIYFENLATDTIYLDANPLCYAKNLYLNGELVTDLVIPEGVSEVKLIAFIRCNSITSVTIPDSVTSIDSCAFYECKNLAKVTIPDSVTTIGYYAFCLCGSLTDVTIPDSVTEIGNYTFYYCSNLTSVTIPDSVTTIGEGTFACCSNLTSVTIPDSVTTIGEWAFGWCESLTSVTIPDSVTEIGYCSFYYCRNLTKVAIGKDVTVIGDGAFQGCYNLNSIYVSDLTAWCNIDFGTATETNPLYNGRNLYLNGSLITDLIIPNGVTEIRQYAFVNCNIRSLIIPDSVTAIRKGAFFNCINLESITLPNSVTTIEEEVFSGCNSIKEFNGQFASDDGKCIIIDGTLISFTDTGDITEYTIPIGVTKIGDYAFFRCINLINVTIPDSVTTIGDCAFSNCSSLTSVTIGDGVTTIGESAFYNCSSLTNVTIPDSVTTIGNYAFDWCTCLTSVTIGDSVTTIGVGAFSGCDSLTSVTIPDSVTTIGDSAFYDCSSLREFSGKYASEDGRCLIIDGTLNSFAPAGLTEYLIPNCVAVIGSGAFAYCTSLTSVTIPDGVTEIKDHAFFCCDSLTSLSIPDGVTCIGFQTFEGCIGLTSVTIPDSVTTIEVHAFRGCSSLTSVTIPDSVTTIGVCAFEGCSSLTSVTIGDNVTTIGYGAFAYCSSLTSVYCKAITPPAGGSNMFYNNAYGRKIYVPMESVEAYKSAEYWSDYADAIVGYNF